MIDIDALAEKVGMKRDGEFWYSEGGDEFDVRHQHLLKFAAAVVASISPQSFMSWQEGYAAGAAAEREACAKVCDSAVPQNERFDDQRAAGNTARQIAAAIRARGQA